MTKVKFIFRTVCLTTLCLALLLSGLLLGTNRTRAAGAFTLSAGEVSGGAFTVTLTFPAVTWNTYNLTISFDHTVIQTANPTHSNTTIIPQVNVSNGNSTGTYKLGGLSMTPISEAVTITMPFTVVNESATSVQISMTITEFALNGQACEGISAAAPVTVTLKTVTPPPPPSSDSEGSGSSEVVTDIPDSDDSDTPVSSGNSNSSGTSDTPNSVSSNKPVSSEKTSSKAPSDSATTDTGLVTDLPEVSDTESVLSSSESDAITDLPVTDTSDSDLSQNSDITSSQSTSSIPLGTQVIRTDGDGNNGISNETVVLLVSIAVASFLCFCLTYLGLRRQTPKNPDEE